MVLGREKRPVRKFYIRLEKQSKEEILEALKRKKSARRSGIKPTGLILKGKSLIPSKILEDLFDLKIVDGSVRCKVGLHKWSDESVEGQKFCRKCFEWRKRELTD